MLSRRATCVLALAGFLLAIHFAGTQQAVAASTDPGALRIVRQSVQVDAPRGLAAFSLQFNRKPDFYTLDSVGRPADSFQYAVDPNWSGDLRNLQLGFGQFSEVVRGDEIHTSGRLLIRSATPAAQPQPNSGGWGPVIASAPFQAAGSKMTFTVSLHQLRADRGTFSYELFTTRYGATVDDIQTRAVPLPPAALAGSGIMGGLALVFGLRRFRRRGA